MPLVIGYSTKGAAWVLGVSVSTIKRMVYRGWIRLSASKNAVTRTRSEQSRSAPSAWTPF